jgi:hypothetical protein
MPALEISVPIAHELLAQCVKQGQALVQRASLVGDFSDYESWKAARNQWVEPTVQALEHMYAGPAHGGEFTQAVTTSGAPQRWQQQYAGDLDAVKAAIELLTVLQSELAFVREDSVAPELLRSPAEEQPPPAQIQPSREPEQDALRHEPSADDPADVASERAPASEHELQAELQPERESEPEPEPERPRETIEASRREEDELRERRGERTPVGAELAPASSRAPERRTQDTGAVSDEQAGAPGPTPAAAKQVLLAHGRNERWMEAVAQLLERAGPHEVTVLNEPSGGRGALAEHFGEPGSRYAIVLLTADDIGAARVESEDEPYYSPRAHQAVVFEMGFLVAALAPGAVCVLYEEGVQLPCDLQDIAYVRLDMAGTWQPKLLLQLRKAGFDYDLNKLAAA